MTSRERITKVLNHETVDKLPVDFGGASTTGIAASTIYKLRKALHLREIPIKITETSQMLGEIDDELREYIPSDVIQLPSYIDFFGVLRDNWKEWRMFDGTPVLVPSGMNTKPNKNGEILLYPHGDETCEPCAKMPKNGYYFDNIIRQGPLPDEGNLIVEDNLEEFTLLSDEELKFAEKNADNLFENTQYAITGGISGTALGDVSLVPAPMLKHPKGIRSIEEWYISIAARQDFLKELFDRQTDIALKNLEMYKEAVGDKINIIYMCGNDFGTQKNPFCSVETFRNLYLPYYKKMNDWVHKNTKWKTFKHSCGAIEPLIDSIIQAGFDILNPVQCSASGMDPQTIKDKYGKRVVFWGGGINTQSTLPFGTPEEVSAEVRNRINIFNKNGGFVFNTIHNTQASIPIANFFAMLDTIKDFR